MIGLFFKVKWFLLKEALEVKKHFPFFGSWNKAFNTAYRFRNPYRICRQHLMSKGAPDIHQYGETPLPVYARMVEECHLRAEDCWVELGCGRGKGSCFVHVMTGCQVQAVDWVPEFIATARNIVAQHCNPKIAFSCEDMLQTDLSSATVIYLFGTCLEEDVIQRLCERFRLLPSETTVITVSYPLSDYDPAFFTYKQFSASFPWGSAEIYVQRIPFTSA